MERFDQHLKEYIIQNDACQHGYAITHQLRVALERRLRKGDVFCQEETCRKSNGENNQKGGDIRADGDKAQVDQTFIQNEVIKYKIQGNIKYSIGSPT